MGRADFGAYGKVYRVAAATGSIVRAGVGKDSNDGILGEQSAVACVPLNH